MQYAWILFSLADGSRTHAIFSGVNLIIEIIKF